MTIGPSYGLNPSLSTNCPEPPVPLARAWAASFPSKSSPFFSPSSDIPLQPLLNLAQGVPGHPPHPTFLKRMVEEVGKAPMETHGYGPVFGDPALRKALARDINNVYGASISEENIACTAGCNLAAAVVFHALAQPGDAIVLPTPWYFNHQMTLASLSIDAVPLPTSSPTFQPSPQAFEELLQKHNRGILGLPKIKGLVLVTPNNPTGSIYSPELLELFMKICAKEGVALVVDETYRDFLLDESQGQGKLSPLARPHQLFEPGERDWQSNLISLHSFSKSYAIPGHRLGAILAHPSLLSQVKDPNTQQARTQFGSFAKSLDNFQICPPRTDTQRTVAWAMGDGEQREWRLTVANDLSKRRKTFKKSLDTKVTTSDLYNLVQGDQEESLKEVQETSPTELGWKLLSAGGYYAYVTHPFKNSESQEVCTALAALVGIVALPGSFFRPSNEAKTDRDIRISIANVPEERLETVPARLVLFTSLYNRNRTFQ